MVSQTIQEYGAAVQQRQQQLAEQRKQLEQARETTASQQLTFSQQQLRGSAPIQRQQAMFQFTKQKGEVLGQIEAGFGEQTKQEGEFAPIQAEYQKQKAAYDKAVKEAAEWESAQKLAEHMASTGKTYFPGGKIQEKIGEIQQWEKEAKVALGIQIQKLKDIGATVNLTSDSLNINKITFAGKDYTIKKWNDYVKEQTEQMKNPVAVSSGLYQNIVTRAKTEPEFANLLSSYSWQPVDIKTTTIKPSTELKNVFSATTTPSLFNIPFTLNRADVTPVTPINRGGKVDIVTFGIGGDVFNKIRDSGAGSAIRTVVQSSTSGIAEAGSIAYNFFRTAPSQAASTIKNVYSSITGKERYTPEVKAQAKEMWRQSNMDRIYGGRGNENKPVLTFGIGTDVFKIIGEKVAPYVSAPSLSNVFIPSTLSRADVTPINIPVREIGGKILDISKTLGTSVINFPLVSPLYNPLTSPWSASTQTLGIIIRNVSKLPSINFFKGPTETTTETTGGGTGRGGTGGTGITGTKIEYPINQFDLFNISPAIKVPGGINVGQLIQTGINKIQVGGLPSIKGSQDLLPFFAVTSAKQNVLYRPDVGTIKIPVPSLTTIMKTMEKPAIWFGGNIPIFTMGARASWVGGEIPYAEAAKSVSEQTKELQQQVITTTWKDYQGALQPILYKYSNQGLSDAEFTKRVQADPDYQNLARIVQEDAYRKQPWIISKEGMPSGAEIAVGKLLSFALPETIGGQVKEVATIATFAYLPMALGKIASQGVIGKAIDIGLTGYFTGTEGVKALNPLLPKEQRLASTFFTGLGVVGLGTEAAQFKLFRGTSPFTTLETTSGGKFSYLSGVSNKLGISTEETILGLKEQGFLTKAGGFESRILYGRARPTGILEAEGKVLITSTKTKDKILVGGAAKPGESAKQALLRETFEETGIRLKGLTTEFLNAKSIPKFNKTSITPAKIEFKGIENPMANEASYVYKIKFNKTPTIKKGSDVVSYEWRDPTKIKYEMPTEYFPFGKPTTIGETLKGEFIRSDTAFILEKYYTNPKLTKVFLPILAPGKVEGTPFKTGKNFWEFSREVSPPVNYMERRGQTIFFQREANTGRFNIMQTKAIEMGGKKVKQDVFFLAPISRYEVKPSAMAGYLGEEQKIVSATTAPPKPKDIFGKTFEVEAKKVVRGEQVLYFQPPLYPGGPRYVGVSYLGFGKNIEAPIEVGFAFPRRRILTGTELGPRELKKSMKVGELVYTKRGATGAESEFGARPETWFSYIGRVAGEQTSRLYGKGIRIPYVEIIPKPAEEVVISGTKAMKVLFGETKGAYQKIGADSFTRYVYVPPTKIPLGTYEIIKKVEQEIKISSVNEPKKIITISPKGVSEKTKTELEYPKSVTEPFRVVKEFPKAFVETPRGITEPTKPLKEFPKVIMEAPKPFKEFPKPFVEPIKPIKEAPKPFKEFPKPIKEPPKIFRELLKSTAAERKREKQKGRTLVIPYGRRYGKFKAIGMPTTLEQAKARGVAFALKTLGASFQIREARTGKKIAFAKPSREFTLGSKGKDIFTQVQVPRARLKSYQERREIVAARRKIKWY